MRFVPQTSGERYISAAERPTIGGREIGAGPHVGTPKFCFCPREGKSGVGDGLGFFSIFGRATSEGGPSLYPKFCFPLEGKLFFFPRRQGEDRGQGKKGASSYPRRVHAEHNSGGSMGFTPFQ